jgi:hypothetical protein
MKKAIGHPERSEGSASEERLAAADPTLPLRATTVLALSFSP